MLPLLILTVLSFAYWSHSGFAKALPWAWIAWAMWGVFLLVAENRVNSLAYRAMVGLTTSTLIADSQVWPAWGRRLGARVLHDRWALYKDEMARAWLLGEEWDQQSESEVRPFAEVEADLRKKYPRWFLELRLRWVAGLGWLAIFGARILFDKLVPAANDLNLGLKVVRESLHFLSCVPMWIPLAVRPERGEWKPAAEISLRESLELWLEGEPPEDGQLRRWMDTAWPHEKEDHQAHIYRLGLETNPCAVRLRDLSPPFRLRDYSLPSG